MAQGYFFTVLKQKQPHVWKQTSSFGQYSYKGTCVGWAGWWRPAEADDSTSLIADAMCACAGGSAQPFAALAMGPAHAGWQQRGRPFDAGLGYARPAWRQLHAAAAGALRALRGRSAAEYGAAACRGARALAHGCPVGVGLLTFFGAN